MTGEMATGKSCFSSILHHTFRCKVFDADKVVHSLYERDITVIQAIKEITQQEDTQHVINRQQLLSKIIEQPHLLGKIEQVVHPKVQEKMNAFVKLCRRRRTHTVVLDIPLLFKIGADTICTSIIILQPNKIIRVCNLRKRCHNSRRLFGLAKLGCTHRKMGKIIRVSSGLSKYELYRYAFLVLEKKC